MEVAAFGIAVEDLHKCASLLNSSESRVMACLARHNKIDIGVLENIVATTGAHSEAADLGCLDIGTDRASDHDVLQTAKLVGDTEKNLVERNGLLEATRGAIACTGVSRGCGLARDCYGAFTFVRSRDNISEPGVETIGGSVDGGMRTVHGDSGLGEMKEGRLLGIFVGDGLEATKDEGVCRDMLGKLFMQGAQGEHTVADDNTDALSDSINCHLEGQVVGHQDLGLSLPGISLRVANQQTNIIPSLVCNLFRVA